MLSNPSKGKVFILGIILSIAFGLTLSFFDIGISSEWSALFTVVFSGVLLAAFYFVVKIEFEMASKIFQYFFVSFPLGLIVLLFAIFYFFEPNLGTENDYFEMGLGIASLTAIAALMVLIFSNQRISNLEKRDVKIQTIEKVQKIPVENLPDIDKEDWLKAYYSKVQALHDNSFRKKDTLTNWSLTILVAFFGIYFGILSGNINPIPDPNIKFILVTGFLIILGQFFSNSLIAYAYLRKYRYLIQKIDSRWITGIPTLEKIMKDITELDIKGQTNVGMREACRAQLKAGFAIILVPPTIVWFSEVIIIQNLSSYHYVGFSVLAIFLGWELWSLWIKKYSKIRRAKLS